MTVSRVSNTPAAAELIAKLRAANGPLLFHQSGGCCDGSSPMCYPRAEFRTGPSDVPESMDVLIACVAPLWRPR